MLITNELKARFPLLTEWTESEVGERIAIHATSESVLPTMRAWELRDGTWFAIYRFDDGRDVRATMHIDGPTSLDAAIDSLVAAIIAKADTLAKAVGGKATL